jgi:hypothetical protein
LQHAFGHIHCAHGRCSGSQQYGNEFGIGEGSRALEQQLFAWPVFSRPAFDIQKRAFFFFHKPKIKGLIKIDK